jgi:hypothetical protein
MSYFKVSEVERLQGVQKVLSGGWVQGYLATDSTGKQVPPDSLVATCFCLSGAMIKCRQSMTDETHIFAIKGIKYYLRKQGYCSLAQYNDHPGRTKEQVIAMLDQVVLDIKG